MGLSQAGGSAFAAQVFLRGTPAALALLKAAWPSAVGPELARRTEVLAIEGSALRVRVPDVRWRKVLHRMQPEILERLRRVAGNLAPRRLGFSEGGPEIQGPHDASPQTTEAGFTPAEVLDDEKGGARTPMTELPDGLAAAASRIEDPEIRAGFERSAARYLEVFRRSPCERP